MQQHGYSADPLTQGMGSVGQNLTFSEHGHVEYQIIENHVCSNMFAHRYTPTLGMGSVGQNSTFSENGYVAHQIKVVQECSNLGIGSVGQNSSFTEHVHVAYQIKENQECINMVANILTRRPPYPGDGVSRTKFNFFRT